MLNSGERLGDWIVEGALGQGATGSVYRCHHVVTGRLRAAVKVIRLADVSEGGRWFLREVEALARLSHPGIVAIRSPGMDTQRGMLFIAMELVEGDTLLNVLRRGPLPLPQFRRLMGRVAEALAFAHSHSIYHRDIKPSNIMLRFDGSPVLVDFGVAVDLEATEDAPESRIGTPSYMPPEAFLSGAVDPAKADVYALGVLMMEALTGKRAFDRITGGGDETQYKNIRRQKVSCTELDPGPAYPDDVRMLIRTATAPWPDGRTITVEKLALALLHPADGSSTAPPDPLAVHDLSALNPQATPSLTSLGSRGPLTESTGTRPPIGPLDISGTIAPTEDQAEWTRWIVGAVLAALILSLIFGTATWWWVKKHGS